MGSGSEAETELLQYRCPMRHSASKEFLPVLAQRQKGRTMSQTPEHGRWVFRARSRELLLQNQCLHGNCSISLIAST